MTGRSDTAASGRYIQGGRVESFAKRIGWWERKPLPRHASDATFVLEAKYHKRPDLLAHDIYGTTKLMWLVLQYNNIVDINIEFVEGQTVVLPTKVRVYSELTMKQDPLNVT